MEITHIYSLVVGSILVVILVHRFLHAITNILHSSTLRHWVFRHLVYPRLHLILPLTYYEVFLQIMYWGGTITSNVVGVNSLRDASFRAARLSIINLAPLLLSSYLGLISYIVGLSSYSVTRIHGSVAIVTLLEAIFHVTTALVVHKPLSFKPQRNIYGLIALIALVVALGALLVRKVLYELFIRVHIALSLIAAFALFLHARNRSSRAALVGSAGLFLLSVAFRGIRLIYRSPVPLLNRGRQAGQIARQIFVPETNHGPIPEASVSRTRYQHCLGQIIESPDTPHHRLSGDTIIESFERCKDNHGLELVRLQIQLPRPWTILAGQYVQLCLPKLGFWSLFQTHPFMITWWEETDCGISIELVIEKKRGFTSKLLEFAHVQKQILFPVLLDGPYGTPSTLHDYGTVLFFADDIGIAAVLPYAKQILRFSQENRCITRKIILIWRYTSKEYRRTIQPFLNNLLLLDSHISSMPHTRLSEEKMLDTPAESSLSHSISTPINHTLHIIQVDRQAPFETEKKYGSNGRATHYDGDRTVQSLLVSHVPPSLGRKVVAVAVSTKTRDEIAAFTYERNNSDFSFKDLGTSFSPRSRLLGNSSTISVA